MARQHITDLRKLRKLSQGGLAKAAGLTSSEISRIECGYRDISESEAIAIAKALGVVPGKIDERLLKPVIGQGIAASGGASAPKPELSSKSLEEDPANFREMPDESVLKKGGQSDADYRVRLGEALKRANQVLHTPKVPAATWRAWREFEGKVQEFLRR